MATPSPLAVTPPSAAAAELRGPAASASDDFDFSKPAPPKRNPAKRPRGRGLAQDVWSDPMASLFPDDAELKKAAAPPSKPPPNRFGWPGAVLGPIVTEFGCHLILVTKREVNRDQVEEKLARND